MEPLQRGRACFCLSKAKGGGGPEQAELRAELLGMRLMALQRRAAAEGVSDEAVEDAMDGEDPKAALVALILDTASSRGPAECALAALQA